MIEEWIRCLIRRLIGWLFDWMIHSFIHRLHHSLTPSPTHRLTHSSTAHSLIHSVIQLLGLPVIQSVIYSLRHSIIQSLSQPAIQSVSHCLIDSLIFWFIHLFIPWTISFIPSFAGSFIHSAIHSCIYSLNLIDSWFIHSIFHVFHYLLIQSLTRTFMESSHALRQLCSYAFTGSLAFIHPSIRPVIQSAVHALYHVVSIYPLVHACTQSPVTLCWWCWCCETREKSLCCRGIRLCHTEVIAEFAVMNVILGVSLTQNCNFSCRPNSKSSVHFLPRAHWWVANWPIVTEFSMSVWTRFHRCCRSQPTSQVRWLRVLAKLIDKTHTRTYPCFKIYIANCGSFSFPVFR